MADHRDYADEPRQPSLFDALAPPSARPRPDEAEPEGRVVEFPRRRDAQDEPDAAASPESSAGAAVPVEAEPTGFVEPAPAADAVASPAPAVAPEDEWLTEIAPEIDEAELSMLAPAGTELAPGVDVTGEPRTQRAAGLPLSGPTLDDVVSRVWEGLVMGLPAACPVCDGEVLPGANGGTCTSCGTTIE